MTYDEFKKHVLEAIDEMPENHVFILRETLGSKTWFPKIYYQNLHGYFGMLFGNDVTDGLIKNVEKVDQQFEGVQVYKKTK